MRMRRLTYPVLFGVLLSAWWALCWTMLGVDTDLCRLVSWPGVSPAGPTATPMLLTGPWPWWCGSLAWSDTVSSSLSPVLTLGLLARPPLPPAGLLPRPPAPPPDLWPPGLCLVCTGVSSAPWPMVSPSSPLSTARLGHEDDNLKRRTFNYLVPISDSRSMLVFRITNTNLASTLCLSAPGWAERSPSRIRWMESWMSASWHISASATTISVSMIIPLLCEHCKICLPHW